ncbi:hypothetical protein [Mesorhizobium sp. B2-8-5]|uniref:hypothetical protein n=1 Tax=Mesorhizobium sp. B2-8-5 TaxID=2589903 RepID=UPI0015E418C4|nr:hypothetical protein [Mesorhizobium sp. B2-8-5]UCI23708.1 hypothetical protein FJ430_19020 [Mesorhizobium sp. B2-8-5]
MTGLALRDEVERADQFYRFSVKCGRAMNARLEAAARAAGVSVTTFVQRHFETILDEPADDAGFSPDVFARKHGISVQAARMWSVMRKQADPVGDVTGALRDFATAARIGAGQGGECLSELVIANLARIIARPGPGRVGTFRISKVA